VKPDELTAEVFLPSRRGSLQTELTASARRRGRLAYTLRPRPAALLQEVASGRPVLVLQNLGLRMLPRWHYAVVVGYDVARDALLLRSGKRARVVLPRSRFMGTWSRAGQWAMVVARPGEIPVSAEPGPYARAVADLEAGGAAGPLMAAYIAGRERWPNEPVLLFGLANQKADHAEWTSAEALLRELLAVDPAHVPARNNLAMVLLRIGRIEEAAQQVAEALAAAQGTPWEAAARATRDEIRAAMIAAAVP
jgi:tetratricopeptide (TPR) repeat protein